LHCSQTATVGRATHTAGSPRYTFSPMKVSALLRPIKGDSWQLTRTRGSHRQYKHTTKPGLVTVPGKPSDDLHLKTLGSIVKQAELRNDTGRTSEAAEGGTT
jgi:predicted RNA binding protein YcfA (HicA-like mRNA interferase family)